MCRKWLLLVILMMIYGRNCKLRHRCPEAIQLRLRRSKLQQFFHAWPSQAASVFTPLAISYAALTAGQWVRVLRQSYKSVEGLATIGDSHTPPMNRRRAVLHAYNLSENITYRACRLTASLSDAVKAAPCDGPV